MIVDKYKNINKYLFNGEIVRKLGQTYFKLRLFWEILKGQLICFCVNQVVIIVLNTII